MSDATPALPILEFVLTHYKNFNARATRDALVAYWRHIERGGKMFWAVAGAMSSAQLGLSLAPAIRAGLIHGLSVTGANLEESLFRLVAHHSYKDFPEYRYLTKHDDTKILEARMRRVTDTSIPEDEAFRAVPGRDLAVSSFRIPLSQLPHHKPANEPLPAFARTWFEAYERGEDMTTFVGTR